MTRLLITMAMVSLLVLAAAGPLHADGASEKPASDEKAAKEAEASGGEKADQTEDPKPAVKEFHLDFDDIKDLRDADIVLPNLDEPEEDANEGQPAGEAAKGEAEEEEGKEGEQEEIDINPTEVVERIIDNMGQAATRLAQEKDPGEKTIQIETKVIEDLSDLIEWVKQQQAQSQQSQQQQQRRQSARDSQRQQQRRRQQSQRGQQQQQTARQPQRSDQPMQDEMATKGQVQEGQLADISEMLEERWGELLPNRPRETMQSIQNMILQEYVDLLDRYYYSLARNKPEIEDED